MTLADWLNTAVADAKARGLPQLEPLLEAVAAATAALRRADFNDEASGRARPASVDPQR